MDSCTVHCTASISSTVSRLDGTAYLPYSMHKTSWPFSTSNIGEKKVSIDTLESREADG